MKNIMAWLLAGAALIPALVLAQAAGPAPSAGSDPCAGPPQTELCPDGQSQCIKLCNPLKGDTTDIKVILGTIIKVALSLVGSLTLLMLVWGGFLWLTSGGNPERVKKGTQTMLWAAIGVIIVFSSYFIVRNFTEYLTTGAFLGTR